MPADVVEFEEWERFHVLRRRAGVTQNELSARSGVNRVYIVGWENGSMLLKQRHRDALWAALEKLGEGAA